jgi:osmotically-inducible protein OsmY
MERSASPGTMHHLMAAAVALIIVACASTPVPEPAFDRVDDAAITAEVEAALVDGDVSNPHTITVTTRDGVVQLNGFVDDRNEKFMVENVVRGVAGVHDVSDELEVRSTGRDGPERF